MAASDTIRYVASVDDVEGDDTQAIMAARSTLVQRASRAGEVGWSTIRNGLAEIVTPDVDNRTAGWLTASLVAQLVMALIRLYSRANPSQGEQTCDAIPGLDDVVKPVQNYQLQNLCDIGVWIIAIARNSWIIRHVTVTHPVEMRAAFRLPSLVYHSILGNSSTLVLELLAYSLIGFFFKVIAFTSDDGQETCSSPGGTWEAYCSSADLSSDDICADRLKCHEAGSSANTKMGESVDSVCIYTAATELHLSNYVLFALQAVNYPSMFLLFTALENSFLKIRWIMLTEQLFMLLMLVDSLALHLICEHCLVAVWRCIDRVVSAAHDWLKTLPHGRSCILDCGYVRLRRHNRREQF